MTLHCKRRIIATSKNDGNATRSVSLRRSVQCGVSPTGGGMERSFAREVALLRKGKGEIFEGEGILAITKALLNRASAMSAAIRARRSRI